MVSYIYRHTFVTDALENGVDMAQVAELLGHTSTDVVMQHDQHAAREARPS
jgi:site-specific recombinase XerD